MDKQEIFAMLRRNGHSGRQAVIYISDFLNITMQAAQLIYENEYLPTLPSFKPKKVDRRANGAHRREITYNGETHSIAEWAKIAGIGRSTLYNRLNNLHWSFARAISQEVR